MNEPPAFFDSHAHLTDERLIGDVDETVSRAREGGVSRMVTIGTDPNDSERACDLAVRLENVWATAGIHPHEASRADAGALERIGELSGRPETVAIGETGLDYYYDNAPRPAQRAAFERQLELAADGALPVVVHSREADEDTAAMVRAAEGAVTGVLHCFAGGAALLDAGLEAGWHVSFSGLVTFKNYDGTDLVRAVPADRLLIETDSPYLAPVPMRGKRNEPAYVRHVAEKVAELRGESLETVARMTTRNAFRFYGIQS